MLVEECRDLLNKNTKHVELNYISQHSGGRALEVKCIRLHESSLFKFNF